MCKNKNRQRWQKKKMEREGEIYKKYYILLKFMQRKEAMVPPKTTKLTKISHFNN